MVPHLGHTAALVVVVTIGFDMQTLVNNEREKKPNGRHLVIISFELDLRSQASTPSNHLCSTFLLPAPPHFLYQPPPGAQQLIRPDFSNVPHFGHIIVSATVGVMDGVPIGVLLMSSRSVMG